MSGNLSTVCFHVSKWKPLTLMTSFESEEPLLWSTKGAGMGFLDKGTQPTAVALTKGNHAETDVIAVFSDSS